MQKNFLAGLRTVGSALAVAVALAGCCCSQDSAQAPAPTETPARQAVSSGPGFVSVGVDEFAKLRQQPDAIVLDVRTPSEFNQGHIPGAVHLDWFDKAFADKAAQLQREKAYLVYCRSGRRSRLACEKLSELGFSKLYNLEGGFNAWSAAGREVER